MNNKHEGFLTASKKGTFLSSVKVPIPDLLQEPYVSDKVRIPFKIAQIKKTGLLPSEKTDKIAAYENQ